MLFLFVDETLKIFFIDPVDILYIDTHTYINKHVQSSLLMDSVFVNAPFCQNLFVTSKSLSALLQLFTDMLRAVKNFSYFPS